MAVIATVVSTAVLGGMGLFSYSWRQNVLKGPLSTIAENIRQTLPQVVYDGITLVEMHSGIRELSYILKLDTPSGSEEEQSEIIAGFHNASVRAVCTNKDWALFLAHGASLRYILLLSEANAGQIPAASFSIVEKTCKPLSV